MKKKQLIILEFKNEIERKKMWDIVWGLRHQHKIPFTIHCEDGKK